VASATATTAASACAAVAPGRHCDAERLRAARLQRTEPGGDRGLERFRGAVAGDDDGDATRGDAGRLVDVERLALLQDQVAVAHRLCDEARERLRERPIGTLADDENERVDVDVGKPCRRGGLKSEVHNSRGL
jgi:hypothetical protein